MADIGLVIKMSEDTYKDIIKNGFIYDEDNEVVTHAIKNGTPLPKGHGRLFDERDIVSSNYEVIGNRIYELEPIIDADKEHKHE